MNDLIINKAADAINNAEVVLIFAGAGMSVDSDLPTYRDKEGFWNDYPLYRNIKKDYVSMASPHGFGRDPHFSWGFFAHQYKLYKETIPHEGYYKLLDLVSRNKDYFVVTTNVDGLFLKAGFKRNHLHEAHGSIHKLQCNRTCQRVAWDIDTLDVEIDLASMNARDPLPICPNCSSVSRPNIFMFGDTDDSYIWEETQESARSFRKWRKENNQKKIVILEIGVGADGLRRHVKKYYHEFSSAFLIRINPEYDKSYSNEVLQVPLGAQNAFVFICSQLESR